MESAGIKITILVLALHLILFSGIYLRKKSRPYNNLLFTLHKTIAVACIIFSILVIRSFLINLTLGGVLTFLLITTATLLLLTFISGVLQSFEKQAPKIVNKLHRLSSYLMLIFMPLTFILIYKT